MRATKFITLFLIGILLFSSFSLQTTQAQEPAPPDELEMLQAYIEDSFETKSPASMDDAPYSPVLNPYLLAKAQPDECYNGIGVPYDGTLPYCNDVYLNGRPKVNQAYVWGLVKPNEDLWFGTAPNTHCMVMGGFLQLSSPIETDSYVCEFGSSQYAAEAGSPFIGDWRPPDAFVFDTNTNWLENKALDEVAFANATVEDVARFTSTLGLRSAGTISDTVFLAGPALYNAGINLFAYDITSGEFISSTTLSSYFNIRKWVEIDGVLYTGVRTLAGGAVLRYIGSAQDDSDLFDFEVVGALPSEVAELTEHDGRLFVSTWPTRTSTAGLFMSPEIPAGGLTAAHAAVWQKVWDILDYEPDPVTAFTTGGGALASFDGYLYWGTMHVPFMSASAHMNLYPPACPDDLCMATYIATTLYGTHRAISILRGKDFGAPGEQIELLYGEESFPVYENGAWVVEPNKMGSVPLYGSSGFGNFFNNYTWTAGVFRDELYFGTMDWSYLAEDGLEMLLSSIEDMYGIDLSGISIPLPMADPGADLWRFPDNYSQAEAIDRWGVGNNLNYGIRTMVIDDLGNAEPSDDEFYLGSANPMNLETQNFFKGGWELIRMQESGPYPDLAISKWVTPEHIAPGDTFTYTIGLENLGIGDAADVVVVDDLSEYVILDPASLPAACYYDSSNHQVYCNLAGLASGAQTSLSFQVQAASGVHWIKNHAQVYNNTYPWDNRIDNNSVEIWTLAEPPVDLGITKTASRESAVIGDTLVYSVTVTNHSPDDFVADLSLPVSNTYPIIIPTYGTAYPYPAWNELPVQAEGVVGKVTVTLDGLLHTRPDDIDLMLVSPQGTKVMLMSDAGSGFNFNANMVITFDDDAPDYLPSATGIISGTYRPTNNNNLIPDYFPLPAPFGPVEDTLSAFNGENPQGVWRLFLVDDLPGYMGLINHGWSLDLTITRRFSVHDLMPDGVTLQGVSAPGWECEYSAEELSCLGSSLPAGADAAIVMTTTVGMTPETSFTNTAVLETEGYDPNPWNHIAEVLVSSWRFFFPLVSK